MGRPRAVRKREASALEVGSDTATATYEPWLTVRDVPSKGWVVRRLSRLSGRAQHVLSGLEESVLLVLEWLPGVLDVREQVAIPLVDSMRVAEELGVPHPKAPGTGDPSVRTTDFVVDLEPESSLWRVSTLALACKPSEDLSDQRVLEKLEIERRYWEQRGVTWRIVTEKELPSTLLANARWLEGMWATDGLPLAGDELDRAIAHLYRLISDSPLASLRSVCQMNDERVGLAPGDSMAIARYAIASRRWVVDMHEVLDPKRPIKVNLPPAGSL